MSEFKAKMHQIRFPPGWSTPDPAEGAYSALTDPLDVFNWPTSEGMEENGKEM